MRGVDNMKYLEIAKNEVRNNLCKFNCIYIYGAGIESVKIISLLRRMQINIGGIVVSTKKNNPDILEGIQVYVFSDLIDSQIKNSAFVIATSKKYREDIKQILNNNGAENVYVICKEVWEQSRNNPKLEITAQIGCAINCKYCPQKMLINSYYQSDKDRLQTMSFDNYKECLLHIPKNTLISFSGFVEPFFHPNAVEMMTYANEQGFNLELFTTFMGLKFEDYLKIREIPFKQVVLHTPDIKKYANICMTDEYNLILNDALNYTRQDGLPLIDSANCQSEPSYEFLELANDRIQVISALIDRAGNLEGDNLKSSGYLKGKIVCNRSKDFNHWVLLPDGTVVLCCMDFGLKHPIGNLLSNTYEEIMNSAAYIELRNGLNDEMSDALCRKCSSARIVG